MKVINIALTIRTWNAFWYHSFLENAYCNFFSKMIGNDALAADGPSILAVSTNSVFTAEVSAFVVEESYSTN